MAQARRAQERSAKVTAGLHDLERWLHDLIRRGLADVQTQPHSFWAAQAARLVDAQAPGVANLLLEMSGLAATGTGWQRRLLERLASVHLLVEGYKRLEALPPSVQADIRSMIGWTHNRHELLEAPGVRDGWLVIGQRVLEEDKLRMRRAWLWGCTSQRPALQLSFAYAGQALDVSLVPGTCVDAELVFYPSAYPLRALVKQYFADHQAICPTVGYATIAVAIHACAAALAQQPWLRVLPLLLQDVVPLRHDDRWYVRDQADHALPLAPPAARGWVLQALSGGHPLLVAGEWDGEALYPLGVWAEGRFVGL
jgi:hypothetical protein